MRAAYQDVREVGSKALPTPQHLLHGMDHSASDLYIQGWLLLLGLKLSCGEKKSHWSPGDAQGQGEGVTKC